MAGTDPSGAAAAGWETRRRHRPVGHRPPPMAKFHRLTLQLEELRLARARIAAARSAELRRLLEEGYSLAELGDAAGLTKSAIQKIAAGQGRSA